ncbi:MAG: ABC transporter permease [Lachnospiraceae bacterium]|nr:ABC transporter permease [Lachnospiraceae bacterium]
MFNLIINEYIKIFKKKSNIFVFAAAYLLLAGLLIFFKAYHINYLKEANSDYSKNNYELEKKFYETKDKVTYECDIMYYQALIDNEIYEDNWKREAEEYAILHLLKNSQNNEYITEEEKNIMKKHSEELQDAVKHNDWKKYLYVMSEENIDRIYTYDEGSDKAVDVFKFLYDNEIEPIYDSTKYKLAYKLVSAQDDAEEEYKRDPFGPGYEEALRKVEKIRYRINNDYAAEIEYGSDIGEYLNGKDTYWKFIKISEYGIFVLGFIILVLAADSIPSEFNSGTIKFLVINKNSKTKIYFSKLITLATLYTLSILILFLVSNVMAFILAKNTDLNAINIVTVGDNMFIESALKVVTKEYIGFYIVNLTCIVLAFSCSTFTKKMIPGICVGAVILFGYSEIELLLLKLGFDFVEYLIVSNLNIIDIINENFFFNKTQIVYTIYNLICHLVVFILIGHDAFCRREIKK